MIAHKSSPDEKYIRDYIKSALRGEPLPPPDKALMNGNYDSAFSLYQAQQAGGQTALKTAWEIVKLHRPHLAALATDDSTELIHADDLINLSMPLYALDYYPLYAGGFNVLVGPSGGGKSFVALDIAGRIAVTGKPVVYIAGEGLSGYAARWESWKKFHQAGRAELYFYPVALQVVNDHELKQFIALIAEHKPELVIVDTLARSMVGFDENSAMEMGRFVASCSCINTELNAAVLVVHHTGKSGAMRGSSALYGAADSVLALTKNEQRITLYNDGDNGGKNKHSAAADPKYFEILPYPAAGLNGAVLVEAQKIADDPDRKLSASGKALLEALDGYEEGMTAKELIEASQVKQSTAFNSLQKLKKAGYVAFDDGRYTLTESGCAALEY